MNDLIYIADITINNLNYIHVTLNKTKNKDKTSSSAHKSLLQFQLFQTIREPTREY